MAGGNRLQVIIDGGYLFKVFAPYRNLGYRYSPKRLTRLLAENYTLTGVQYVNSINDRDPAIKEKQERFYEGLKRYGWTPTILPLQWPGGEARQKGTDSTITLLIYQAAVQDTCDTIILLAADSDFAPPVTQAVELGKVVRNAYFSIRKSYHLSVACNGPAVRLDDLDFLYQVGEPFTLVTPRSLVLTPG